MAVGLRCINRAFWGDFLVILVILSIHCTLSYLSYNVILTNWIFEGWSWRRRPPALGLVNEQILPHGGCGKVAGTLIPFPQCICSTEPRAGWKRTWDTEMCDMEGWFFGPAPPAIRMRAENPHPANGRPDGPRVGVTKGAGCLRNTSAPAQGELFSLDIPFYRTRRITWVPLTSHIFGPIFNPLFPDPALLGNPRRPDFDSIA